MSVIAGVLFFDGRPTADARRELIVALQPLAPDGVAAFSANGLVMARGACHVWAGERASTQPKRSPAGLVITWDGRLDNRQDLLCRLGGATGDDTSDAAIALSIFERGGVDGLRLLVGEWSLAIWSPSERALWLARDYMGIRPLYYHRGAQSIMWSSSLGELATRADCADALDDRFAASFMALCFSTDVTPYTSISGVPTACCVRVSADCAESRQTFWRLEPAVVRYRDRRAYEDQLLALWRDAVGARLRVDGTAWAELSGGLDSSSIVCMADRLVRDRDVAATAVQPVSHVAMRSPEGDERRFIESVEARVGVRSDILGYEEHQDRRAPEWDWVTPLAPRGIQIASEQQVACRGGRIILSGRMGDLVMGCFVDHSIATLDDFADGRVFSALSKMRLWSRACRKPFIDIARGLVQEVARALHASGAANSLNDSQHAGLDLLTPHLRRFVLESASVERIPSVRLSQRKLAASIAGYAREARLEARSAAVPVTYTYPFAHRPLVEYMLSIPGEELSAPGVPRSLMRRAFDGLVPDRVLRRVSKGYYPPAVTRALRPLLSSLLPVDRLEMVHRGWIDAARLDAAVRIVTDGGGATRGEVQRALYLEDWLRSRHRRGPAAIRNRKEVTSDGVLIA